MLEYAEKVAEAIDYIKRLRADAAKIELGLRQGPDLGKAYRTLEWHRGQIAAYDDYRRRAAALETALNTALGTLDWKAIGVATEAALLEPQRD